MFNTNIQKLLDDLAVPFRDEILINYKETTAGRIFLPKHEFFENAAVDLSRVWGTSHPSYAGHSLEYIIKNHPRRESNFALLGSTPNYYLDNGKKDHWGFTEIDRKLYIVEGNFRTAVARFLFYFNRHSLLANTTISGVTLTRYFYDLESEDRINEIREIIKTKKLDYLQCKVDVGHDPFSGYFEVIIENTEPAYGKFKILKREDLCDFLGELRRTNMLTRFLGKTELQRFFRKRVFALFFVSILFL